MTQQTPFQQAAQNTPAENATSTPAETSPTTPASDPPAPPSPDDFRGAGPDVEGAVADFLAIQDFGDDSEEPQAPAPPQQVPPAQQAQPAPQEAPQPAPTQQQTAPPPQVPPQQPQVAQPASAQTPPAVAPQPGEQPVPGQTPQAQEAPQGPQPGQFAQLQAAVQQQREALEGQLASMYSPTEKDMEEFLDKPQVVLGKLAARLHMEVVQNTLGVLAQNIPAAVMGVMQAQKMNEDYENQFFTKWPQLDRKNAQHMAALQQIGRAYAQANPQADSNTRIQQIGAQAIVALNLLPTQAPPVVQPQVQAQQPFAPAGNGVAPAAPANQLEGWEAISQALGADLD